MSPPTPIPSTEIRDQPFRSRSACHTARAGGGAPYLGAGAGYYMLDIDHGDVDDDGRLVRLPEPISAMRSGRVST
jgi:hypothetical protein